MNRKALLLALLFLSPLLHAETLFRIHDGKAWRDFDSTEWDKLPRSEIKAMSREKTERVFSGVALTEILKTIPAPEGQALRGPELNRVLLITADDGYQVSFSLAELDPSFRKQNIIIADKADGKPLTEFEGKRMLVCGDELRHSRWIRRITAFILTRPISPPAE